MLENLSRDPPHQSSSSVDFQLIPDPWEAPVPNPQTKYIPESWQFPKETHPLIPSAGIPGVKQLPAPPSPVQLLLQDEMKLRFDAREQLKSQLDNALALLYWLNTVSQQTTDWQMA